MCVCKYSVFKTHWYRHHKNPSVSELDIMQGPYTCENISCQKQRTDLKDLAHLRSHLSKSKLVNCSFAKCGKAFKVRYSFYFPYIQDPQTAVKVSATCSVEVVSTEPASDVMESGTADQEVMIDNLKSFIDTLVGMFMCFYIFTMHYPVEIRGNSNGGREAHHGTSSAPVSLSYVRVTCLQSVMCHPFHPLRTPTSLIRPNVGINYWNMFYTHFLYFQFLIPE